MRKWGELTEQRSCMNRAGCNEMVFVLLARDTAAPVAIRAWIEERILLGKNQRSDGQIQEAEHCAQVMENQNRDTFLEPGTIQFQPPENMAIHPVMSLIWTNKS